MNEVDIVKIKVTSKPTLLVEEDDEGHWYPLILGRSSSMARKKPNAGGYVVVNLPGVGRNLLAHRVTYTSLVGPIPDGLTIDHLCRVRGCCNPAHGEPVTHAVNILRGAGTGAANAVKTHCKNGHEFTPRNTYLRPEGGRTCRECGRIRAAERIRRLHGDNS